MAKQICIISKKFPTTLVTYAMKDVSDEEIKGRFYEPELQLIIKEDNVYDLEKVIKARRRNGKTITKLSAGIYEKPSFVVFQFDK